MAFVEKTIEKETLLTTPIFTLVKHQIMGKNDKPSIRYIIEHKGAVAIAALTPEKKLLLIRQYRKALEKEIWEIPAGKIDPEESPKAFTGSNGKTGLWVETAKRELREETGWEAKNWNFLCDIHGAVGYCNEKIEIWKADCTALGNTDFDDTEDIDLYEISLEKALEMVHNGEITDAKTITAILLLNQQK